MYTRNLPLTTLMRLGAILLAAACLLVSTGCASRTIPGSGAQSLAIEGGVHGGQQPISGALVYLFASHTDNSGTVSIALLPNPATTDANGAFTLDPSSYTCASPNDQVFFIAAGGDPGAGTVNHAITLVDLFGSCGDLNASSFVAINEVTTVAAAFALAPVYGNSYLNSNSFSSGFNPQEIAFNNPILTQPTQIAQLFTNATSLVNPATGAATTNFGPQVQTTINALGNTTAACVNSTSPSSSACQNLFSTIWGPELKPPSDTFQALLYLAETPNSIPGSLVSLAPPSAPFQPTLSADPPTWAMPAFYANTNGLNWSPMTHPMPGPQGAIQ